MTKHPAALAIALAFAASVILPGCDRTSKLTEQEYIQRAKDFEDKGNLKGSIVELKNAIQKNPDSPQARLLLGQIYLKVGMGAEAEKELSQAEKLGVNRDTIKLQLGEALLLMGEYKRVLDEIQPDGQASKANRARIFQLRADALFNQGMVKEACNVYQQSLDIDISNPPTYWGLAQCSATDRDIAKAKEWLNKALKLESKQANTWFFVGELEQFNKNFEAALTAYSNALKIEPEYLDALQSRAIINLGLSRIESARADVEKLNKISPRSVAANHLNALLKFRENLLFEAREASLETLKIDPGYLPALLLGGAIESALGNLQTAESHLNKVVRATPRNQAALRMLAAIQIRQGRPDDAEKTLAIFDLENVKDPGVLAVAGEIALAKKEFSKAASYFEKAAELNPDNAAIRTELGMARMAQGDNRAIADLQTAAEMAGANTRVDNILILNLLKKKQFDAALNSIAVLEKKQPKSPLPWNYRGAVYLGKKDIKNARSSFEQALKIDEKFFAAAANLAQLDLMVGQTESARRRFENILKADPNNLQAMLALADLSQREKNEKAYMDWLEKAAKAHPQSLAPREGMARHLLEKGENSKALATAREAVSANPDNAAALNLLGSTQLATGDSASAIATFTSLTKRADRSPEAYLQLALALLTEKNFADARLTLQKALKIKPDHLQSLDALLRIELEEKKPEAALLISRQIQAQHPQSPLGFDREADIRLAQKRLPEAIKAYEQALNKRAGSAALIKLFRAHVLAGNSKQADQLIYDWLKQHPNDNAVRTHAATYYLANGRNKEAIAHYLEVLRQMPDDVITLNNLATLYQREKDKRALSTAEQALKLAPNSAAVQDTVGWILVEQGQLQRGLELLRKALTKAPKEASLRYHHAVALARTGSQAQARKELEQLLKDTPKFPEVEEAKTILKSL